MLNIRDRQDTMMSHSEDYYKILDIPENADLSSIKAAYKKRAPQVHPDKNIGNEAEATAAFQQLHEAYEILSDPHKRALYDSERRSQSASAAWKTMQHQVREEIRTKLRDILQEWRSIIANNARVMEEAHRQQEASMQVLDEKNAEIERRFAEKMKNFNLEQEELKRQQQEMEADIQRRYQEESKVLREKIEESNRRIQALHLGEVKEPSDVQSKHEVNIVNSPVDEPKGEEKDEALIENPVEKEKTQNEALVKNTETDFPHEDIPENPPEKIPQEMIPEEVIPEEVISEVVMQDGEEDDADDEIKKETISQEKIPEEVIPEKVTQKRREDAVESIPRKNAKVRGGIAGGLAGGMVGFVAAALLLAGIILLPATFGGSSIIMAASFVVLGATIGGYLGMGIGAFIDNRRKINHQTSIKRDSYAYLGETLNLSSPLPSASKSITKKRTYEMIERPLEKNERPAKQRKITIRRGLG